MHIAADFAAGRAAALQDLLQSLNRQPNIVGLVARIDQDRFPRALAPALIVSGRSTVAVS